MKKVLSLWGKIPKWIKILVLGILSSLIAALIFPPINKFLKAIYIFFLKLLDIKIPDIILLSLSILALLLCIKKRHEKTGSIAKIVLKYPSVSISILEGLAGRTDRMLEKGSLIAIFKKINSDYRVADIQILLEDLLSYNLISNSTPFYAEDDREFYEITTLGFEYLYDKTRKIENKRKS